MVPGGWRSKYAGVRSVARAGRFFVGNAPECHTFDPKRGADPRHAKATNSAMIRRIAQTSVSLAMSSGCAVHF